MFETEAKAFDFGDGFVNVINREVQDRKGCRCVVWLGINEYRIALKGQLQTLLRFAYIESECATIELLGFLQVVYGKAGKRFGLLEHIACFFPASLLRTLCCHCKSPFDAGCNVYD